MVENQQTPNIAFIMQSAPGIRKKIQKLEGFEGIKRSRLLETDQKVYNCDSVEEKQNNGFTWAAVAVLRETNK